MSETISVGVFDLNLLRRDFYCSIFRHVLFRKGLFYVNMSRIRCWRNKHPAINDLNHSVSAALFSLSVHVLNFSGVEFQTLWESFLFVVGFEVWRYRCTPNRCWWLWSLRYCWEPQIWESFSDQGMFGHNMHIALVIRVYLHERQHNLHVF